MVYFSLCFQVAVHRCGGSQKQSHHIYSQGQNAIRAFMLPARLAFPFSYSLGTVSPTFTLGRLT